MSETPAHTFFAAAARAASARPPLERDIETEVCIIGGGFAGLWVARSLLERGREVVLLESGEIASGATGQNAGFVSAGFAERLPRIIERVGLDHARSLYQLSRDGLEIVRSAAGEDADLDVKSGRLNVFRYRDEVGIADYAEMLARDFHHEIKIWPKSRVRAALVSDRYYQGLFEADAFHLHPLNFARMLAAEIESRGGKIYEHSTVITADLDGVRKLVKTETGSVRAFNVVLAGNTALGRAFPRLTNTLLPVRTHIAVTEPLGDLAKKAIRFDGAVTDTRRGGDYYRLAGDRLLWGGRITTRRKPPRKLARLVAKDIARVYPQLKDVQIEYAWYGTMCYAIHQMPQIGMVRPGVWIASAFGGHGLNTAAMAGDLIASAITERDDRWQLFTPFGLVWAGGPIGRVVVQTSYWSTRVRDGLAEQRARRIERDEAAVAAGFAPGFFAHVGRGVKRRAAESIVGRAAMRLFAGLRWIGCRVYKALAVAGAWVYAALTAISRVIETVAGFAARMIGKAAIFIWKYILAPAGSVAATIWTRFLIPALKRLLEAANFAGGRTKAASVKFLDHARRSAVSLVDAGKKKMATKADNAESAHIEEMPPARPVAAEQSIAIDSEQASVDPAAGNAGKPRKKKKKNKTKKDSVEV